jgi:hypothetical protein
VVLVDIGGGLLPLGRRFSPWCRAPLNCSLGLRRLLHHRRGRTSGVATRATISGGGAPVWWSMPPEAQQHLWRIGLCLLALSLRCTEERRRCLHRVAWVPRSACCFELQSPSSLQRSAQWSALRPLAPAQCGEHRCRVRGVTGAYR